MSVYQKLARFGARVISPHLLFKYGFNLSPMYRRSTGRITFVSKDLLEIRIKVPISYKNRNYVSSIFGGSMFSAVDPFPMVQLMNLLDDTFIVWDKSAEINFLRPARKTLYASFTYSTEELNEIRTRVAAEKEIEIIKTTKLTDKEGETVFCEVKKKLYIADKAHYKQKRLSQ